MTVRENVGPVNSKIKAGVLGAADGATSIAGVVAGGAGAGVGHQALAVTAIGGALAAAVSMAGAEWLSEDATDWSAVKAMAAGTLIGAALPSLPLLFTSGLLAVALVVGVSLAVGAAVAETRHRSTKTGRARAYAGTVAVLAAGALVGWLAGRYL